MYLLPNQAMELLQITTRQGLHKVAVNHNITVKSQGAGKPNLYLKSDLERYKKDNAKNIEKKKTKTVIEKAEKVKKEKVQRKVKNQKLKVETKKELNLISEDENLFDDEDIIKPKLLDFSMKDLLNEIGQNEFDRVVELLKENGTYKEQDRALVLTYAVSFQNWVFATVASGQQDNTTTDSFGNLKLHPYFTVAEKCATQMTKNANMLGIGIRSRIGLEIKKEKKKGISSIINAKGDFE
ncbi:P27 family phage terminase small subunit [Cetobacterium sp.]|uniref:P27 family phage terminase small subunit n=1 Tax=Cetobacterium sp. TaxID=2071632 RepID=UPI003F35DF6D